jgi:peroxiredoxin
MTQTYLGMAVPDFTLASSDGQMVTLSSLRGQKVLFYFFTSPGGGN